MFHVCWMVFSYLCTSAVAVAAKKFMVFIFMITASHSLKLHYSWKLGCYGDVLYFVILQQQNQISVLFTLGMCVCAVAFSDEYVFDLVFGKIYSGWNGT